MAPEDQDVDRSISDCARCLLNLHRRQAGSPESHARLSLLLGALHFLRQAWLWGFRGYGFRTLSDQEYGARLADAAQALADGGVPGPDTSWLAGVYFATAKARLAFAYERELRLLTGNTQFNSRLDLIEQVRGQHGDAIAVEHLEQIARDINQVKHWPDHFRHPRRVEGFAEVLRAVDEFIRLASLPGQPEAGVSASDDSA
jgi:hypothetical protein